MTVRGRALFRGTHILGRFGSLVFIDVKPSALLAMCSARFASRKATDSQQVAFAKATYCVRQPSEASDSTPRKADDGLLQLSSVSRIREVFAVKNCDYAYLATFSRMRPG